MIDEVVFKDWDYWMDVFDFILECCEELERIYWKMFIYVLLLYGVDFFGILFSEDVKFWNLNKLLNLLDVLGIKVFGVNIVYFYFGMWKVMFVWYLEDVDFYSINYLYFGVLK